MTSVENPLAIRYFQSICDSCQDLVTRFHAPETGEVFVTLKADNHLAISEHFGVWRAKFGLEWNITAVLNDTEVIKRNKQVAEAVAAMG